MNKNISCPSNAKRSGFTLLEALITIILGSVLGILLVYMFGTSLTKSSLPLHWTKNAQEAQSTMDTIIADYVRSFHAQPSNNTLETLSANRTNYENLYGTNIDMSWNGTNLLIICVNSEEHTFCSTFSRYRNASTDPMF